MTVKNLIKFCDEPNCRKKMIFLFNPKSKKMVPVDYDTLTTDEVNLIENKAKKKELYDADVVLCFNGNHHVSHFKTCTKPNLFSARGKEDEQ